MEVWIQFRVECLVLGVLIELTFPELICTLFHYHLVEVGSATHNAVSLGTKAVGLFAVNTESRLIYCLVVDL